MPNKESPVHFPNGSFHDIDDEEDAATGLAEYHTGFYCGYIGATEAIDILKKSPQWPASCKTSIGKLRADSINHAATASALNTGAAKHYGTGYQQGYLSAISDTEREIN